MQIQIDLKEILNNVNIKYSRAKDSNVNINGVLYTLEECLEMVTTMNGLTSELLYIVNGQLKEK